MNTGSFHDEHTASPDLVDRWFRQLDQRPIYRGAREWHVQVTGILREEDVIWIQIADESRCAGSVLLRIRGTTSLDHVVGALASRHAEVLAAYPKVISVSAPQWLA